VNAGLISIQGPFGGDGQTVKVTNSTKVVGQTTISVSELKAGDQVQVQGVPTAIVASSITAGQLPDAFPGFGGPRGGPMGPGGGNRSRGGPDAFASATGKVTSTSPLTISLSGDTSLVLKFAKDAKVTRISTVPLNIVKVGDRIMAAGQPGNDGFVATAIAVNLEIGGDFGPGGPGGFGGFGGPRGPGGPGGPGGFPPPGGPGPVPGDAESPPL